MDELEKGGTIEVIYTDFEKAFDKIPHPRLIGKLHSYRVNINIILWIMAFLTDRRQHVVINGQASSWSSVFSSIPQGPTLGSLLFITVFSLMIYLNFVGIMLIYF